MKCAVIIPAAGSASRYTAAGGLRHKIDEDLGGKVVLQRVVELFTKFDFEDLVLAPIIVAGPHDEQAFADFKLRHADRMAILGVTLCRGGPQFRTQSVRAAVAHVPEDCTHIAVHDGVRCCTPVDVLERVFRAAQREKAVIPAIDVNDTLKLAQIVESAQDEVDPLAAILQGAPRTPQRFVVGGVGRAGVVAVQTPQVFDAVLLRAAYAALDPDAEAEATDDAGVVERYARSRGEKIGVRIVDGDVRNIKLTRPVDLTLARAILGVRGPDEKPAHKRF